MDSAADSLLALSTTAAALADAERPQDEDDRSSSLSELEGELDEEDIDDGADEAGDEADPDIDADADADLDVDDDDEELEDGDEDEEINETPNRQGLADGDSEAETERLEESPDKLNRRKSFVATPSKLAQPIQMNHSPNERPEIESLTDSAISSPISSNDDSDDDLSDAPAENEDEDAPEQNEIDTSSPNKRKRDEDDQVEDIQERNRKRRTLSDLNENARLDRENAPVDPPSRESKDGSAEPAADAAEADAAPSDEEEVGVDETDTGTTNAKVKKPTPPSRMSSRRKGKDDQQQDTEADAEEDGEGGVDSEDEEVDDVDAAAKTEEEQAKRMAAMEGLTIMERHFALLRDRLYDEKIATIHQELAQLAEPTPTHPELIKQVEVVKRYRDQKLDHEQKLLVYKIGSLKRKSVAERAQAHSAYLQDAREIRERHLERLSEHFYRIQRERFKSETTTPSYSVPFATKRSKQVIQQTAYNKEVSLLSGVAKYVGFPAAPDLSQSSQKELEDDLSKMGVSRPAAKGDLLLTSSQLATQTQMPRPVQRVTSTFSNMSVPTAEEQSFLDKNPWAMPPSALGRIENQRQLSNRSPMPEVTYLTPANQQRQAEKPRIMGSASTIAEYASSSQINTPHDASLIKAEHQASNGYTLPGHRESISPLDTRRNAPVPEPSTRLDPVYDHSSPVPSRMAHIGNGPQRYSALGDSTGNRTTASPTLATKTAGITTGPGMGLSRYQ